MVQHQQTKYGCTRGIISVQYLAHSTPSLYANWPRANESLPGIVVLRAFPQKKYSSFSTSFSFVDLEVFPWSKTNKPSMDSHAGTSAIIM
jgi:hypothetical protein